MKFNIGYSMKIHISYQIGFFYYLDVKINTSNILPFLHVD